LDHHGFAAWNGLESRSKGLQPLVILQTHEEPNFFLILGKNDYELEYISFG
jgi:hypothetical protein